MLVFDQILDQTSDGRGVERQARSPAYEYVMA